MTDAVAISAIGQDTYVTIGTVAMLSCGVAWLINLVTSGSRRVEKTCMDRIAEVDGRAGKEIADLREDLDEKHSENRDKLAEVKHLLRGEVQAAVSGVSAIIREDFKDLKADMKRIGEDVASIKGTQKAMETIFNRGKD